MRIQLSFAVWLMLVSCQTKDNRQKIKDPVLIPYAVQSTLPHDPLAFTQGLQIQDGELYESTGQESSWIGKVDIATGKADRKVTLDNKYFGEGLTIFGNRAYQLTWQSKKGFVYRYPGFEKVKDFSYKTEGWGLTHDSTQLIMSDGSNKLYFLDTASLAITKTLEVHDDNGPVNALNELEYADGKIFANIWQTDFVARIDPATGKVEGYLDLSPLTRQAAMANPKADVLNGIAWHAGTRTLLVTGKLWPYLFILKLKEPLKQ